MKKIIAITGSTGGLCSLISKKLAQKGYDLIFVDRNEEKSAKNAQAVKSIAPDTDIMTIKCDLNSVEDVLNAAKTLKTLGVNILMLGAGIYNVPIEKSESGYINVFQVNFLSQYFLADYLAENCPSLEKVVAIGSVAHDFNKFDGSDVDFSTRKKASSIYGNSKRFLMAALYERFSSDRVKLSVAHPGVTLTNMTNHYPKAINGLVKAGIKIFFPSPEKAIRSIVDAVDTDCGYKEWIGPSVFGVWGKPKKSRLKTMSEEEIKAIKRATDEIFSNKDCPFKK